MYNWESEREILFNDNRWKDTLVLIFNRIYGSINEVVEMLFNYIDLSNVISDNCPEICNSKCGNRKMESFLIHHDSRNCE